MRKRTNTLTHAHERALMSDAALREILKWMGRLASMLTTANSANVCDLQTEEGAL